MRGKQAILVASAVFISVSLGGFWMLRKPGSANPSPLTHVAAAVAPFADPGANEISLTGKVEARKVVAVPAPVGGIIDELLVDVGQDIYEGQILARIKNGSLEERQSVAESDADRAQNRVNTLESSIITARLEASRANADSARAKAEYERSDKAFKKQQMLNREGATPRLTYEKAQSEFNAAASDNDILAQRAKSGEERIVQLIRDLDATKKLLEQKNEALETAKADLQSAIIHSPVDGVLVSRTGELGAEVKLSTEDLFVIAVDLIDMQVTVEPEAAILARIKPGQAALVTLTEYGNEPIQGRVEEVDDTGAVIAFLSPSPAIKPGLTANVRIQIADESPPVPAAPIQPKK